MENVTYRYVGRAEYGAVWEMQKRMFNELLEAKKAGIGAGQTLLMVEHPHVYTLGKSGHESNMLVSDEFLRSIGASYFHTDRGGDITYHGYGQLVGYPILDLERLGLSLKEYVWTVEECVIRTVAEYGIEAGRLDGATGVWIEGDTPRARKICAIGVKASRYVTMHGFALNVTTICAISRTSILAASSTRGLPRSRKRREPGRRWKRWRVASPRISASLPVAG